MNDKQITIVLFYCANSLDTGFLRKNYDQSGGDEIKMVSLPCSGKVNLLYLLKPFEKGANGVILVTCKTGGCRFLEGNLRAKKRSAAVDGLLEETGLGKGRIRVIQQEDDGGAEKIVNEIKKMAEEIRHLP
jgi:coenzyme F420-reducing hydrogenase delta subunit